MGLSESKDMVCMAAGLMYRIACTMNSYIQSTLFTATFFVTAKFFTMSIVYTQMYEFILNLNSLQQKFS